MDDEALNPFETQVYDPDIVQPPARLKAPRKPRPSEIAAKAAKLKKPKRKKKVAAKKKFVKTAKRQAPARKAKRSVPKRVKKVGGARFERLNFRVTKAEKGKLKARAKKAGGTITDVLIKLIAKLK
jgi:hypothetical protein